MARKHPHDLQEATAYMNNMIQIPGLGFTNSLESVMAFFDHYTDTRIFIKDTESRYVYANQSYADLLKTTPEEMAGKSDFDFYECNMADLYLEEDRKTLAGQSFINKRWMVPDGNGVISWCISHKFPLRGEDGSIHSIFGTFRDLHMAGAEAKPYFDLAEVVQHIHTHYADDIRAEDLAKMLSLSVSQLNRKFSSAMGKSPISYLLDVRINQATTRLIQTDETISEISSACGFNSQTYFNRQFKATTGMTPKQYRDRYA